MASTLLASLGTSLVAYMAFRVVKFLHHEYFGFARLIPGPKPASLLYGNLKEIEAEEFGLAQERWLREYGHTIKYRRMFGRQRILTTDPKAVNHFLTHYFVYKKPTAQSYTLGRLLGNGLLIAEGDEHRKQRKILNPAFGPAQIRGFTDLFWQKSLELRDVWDAQISASPAGVATIDALSWTARATLDIIGLGGFNYDFNALHPKGDESELGSAISSVLFGLARGEMWRLLKIWYPVLRVFRSNLDNQMDAAQNTMTRVAKQLVQESKNEMAANGTFTADGSASRAKDLLSLLLRANTAKDVPEAQRLTDDDVVAQIPTFFLAGHETTSTGTTWGLFALSQNQAAQRRLREELLAVPSDTLDMDALNELPYLDCVVREILRLHAPAPQTMRVATQDDVVPLATPFKDVNGVMHDTIQVKKGQPIVIPIISMNRSVEVWGPDAYEFIPERWEGSPPASSLAIPGVWGHMMTFLGGPRACIGYRFSLFEMKCLLFTLIRAFEFELAVPREDIGKKQGIVLRPFVKSEMKSGLPLRVRRVR
ncbi:Cytochrome P450 [Mycena chlorophos]|uniref:Cytochrome P450 n=1 Tax=Mycena chlorophos TaxID=658473 RepID=A0A8H6SIG0_MYCCL|nr:Cytochrome P450 [Mycena chlorophos]